MSSKNVRWVPDDQVKVCPTCSSKFSTFLRKHHCRCCGNIFCAACSEKKANINNSLVRVCNACHDNLTSKKITITSDNNKSNTRDINDSIFRILYETRSVCISCAVVNRTGFKFGNNLTYVIQLGQSIYMFSQCPSHPIPQISLLHSNATFFHRLLNFMSDPSFGFSFYDQYMCLPCKIPNIGTNDIFACPASVLNVPVLINPPLLTKHSQHQPIESLSLDSKAIYSRLLYPEQSPLSLPLFVDLHLSPNGVLIDRDTLKDELNAINNLYPPSVHYIVRVVVGVVELHDMSEVANLILAIDHALNEELRNEFGDITISSLSGPDGTSMEYDLDESLENLQLDPSTYEDNEESQDRLAQEQARSYRAFLLVDCSYERLIALASLSHSPFIRSRIYPQVRYSIEPGHDFDCVKELTAVFKSLAQFPDLSVAVNIILESNTLPTSPIVNLLLKAFKQVRIVLFTLKRDQNKVIDHIVNRYRSLLSAYVDDSSSSQHSHNSLPPIPSFNANERAHPNDVIVACQAMLAHPSYNNTSYLDSVDPMPVVNAIHQCTNGIIGTDSWVPLAAVRVLGPVLRKIGFGTFCSYPDPLSAFSSVVIHEGAFSRNKDYIKSMDISAVNLSHVIDIKTTVTASLKTAKESESGSKLGILNTARLLRTLSSALKEDSPISMTQLISTASQEEQMGRVKHVQFFSIVVENDLSTTDLLRRMRPLAVTRNKDNKSPITFVASDNMCL